jgi:cob(I)alamin adenosyltransferase
MAQETGYIHVYTGNGKGKTTAAMGLAVRAAGAGLPVFVAQFVKGMKYAEVAPLEQRFENITIKQYGRDCFISKDPDPEDVEAARRGLEEVRGVLRSGEFRVVILDEATIAVYYRLFSIEELLAAVAERAPEVEVVITGRYAGQELMAVADLVTEMVEIKHYYTRGVVSRPGIDC